MPDFTKSGLADLESLKSNEFFAKRWWELARLDYRTDYVIPMITCDEL